MKKNKVIVIASLVCALLGFAIYSGFWFWMAGEIREEMGEFAREADENNIRLMPRAMDVRGYPGKHEAYFSGRAAVGEYVFEIPALSVRSHFVPGDDLVIDAPEGGSLADSADSALWSVNRLLIDTRIPLWLPADLTHEDLRAWKDSGQTLVLDNMEIGKGPLAVKASGEVMLDDQLQPAGTFSARVTGHMAFLQWLQQERYVETKEALLAGTILAGLTRTDADTGESYIDVNLTLQNRTLFLGPLRVGEVPQMEWGWRHPPARYPNLSVPPGD